MSLSKYIVFEDKNLLIINKPSGLLSERSGDDTRPSLDQQVEKYLDNKLPAMAVNRLDKDTSGLIIFAKTTFAATEMSKVLADHTIAEKHYLALVKGVITESGIIEAPSRKSFERKKMVIAPLKSGAKLATTKYQVVENFQKYTLLNVQLLTGRTHQIRAHMSYMRH
ncbi:MAG: RluA family pseudouridine synthase, partial [Erysipelotrichia bacterium]|nr:RluA family pseudouridine synthase [Erysipelotrichia bacterium]